MRRTSRFQVFLAFFMVVSMVQSVFAETMTPDQPSTGSATIVLTDEFGSPVLDGCFLVTVSGGQQYNGCDNSGAIDGKVELHNIPVGSLTVEQTSGPDTHMLAAPVTVTVEMDGLVVVPMTAYSIPPAPVVESQPEALNQDDDSDGNGSNGEAGDTGETGDTGEVDETGDAGETDDVGDADDTGDAEETGNTGDTGEADDSGDTGDVDDNGNAGDTDDGNDTGETGDSGEADNTGESGDTGTGGVDDNGDSDNTAETDDAGDIDDTEEPENPVHGPDQDVVDDNKSVETEDDAPETTGRNSLDADFEIVPLAGEQPTAICTYRPASGNADFSIYLTPPNALATITIQPYSLQNQALEPIVVDGGELWSAPGVNWRRVEWRVDYEDGTSATGNVGCIATPQTTSIETQLIGADGAPIVHDSNVIEGTAVGDSATLSNQTIDAGGTVTYNVYQGLGCSGNTVHSETVPVSNGEVQNAAPWVPDAGPGWYTWQAVYSGDALNTGSTSPCSVERVFYGQMQPELSTTPRTSNGTAIPQLGSVPFGTDVYDSATLTPLSFNANNQPDAGGMITYTLYRYDNGTCEAADVYQTFDPQPVVNGVVPNSPLVTDLPIGTYAWGVEYVGDAKNASASSPCADEVFEIDDVIPTVTTTMMQVGSDDPIAQGGTVKVGTEVYDTAVITGFAEPLAGTVIYELFDSANCGGDPIFTSGPHSVGSDGSVPNSGTTTLPGAGTYNWVVTYTPSDGSPNQSAVSGCGDETLNAEKYDPGIVTSPSADGESIPNNAVLPLPEEGGITVGDSSSLTGEFLSPTEGTVTFRLYAGYQCTGTPIATIQVPIGSDGVATIPADDLVNLTQAGTYNWTASWPGDDANNGATSPCGAEQFHVTSTGVGGAITTQPRTANGPINDGAAINFGTGMFDTAALHGTISEASGTLTYYVYWSPPGQPAPACSIEEAFDSFQVNVVYGVVDDSPVFTPPHAGTYEWQAVFVSGGQTYTSPCGAETVIVNRAPTTTTTTMYRQDGSVLEVGDSLLVGDLTYDGASVVGQDATHAPTGTFTFRLFNNANCSGTPLQTVSNVVVGGDGTATSAQEMFTVPAVGVYNWTVAYSGDGLNAPSTSACTTETFFVQVQPDIVTRVMQAGEDVTGQTVLPGTLVYDTAELIDAAPGAGGTVTYRLYNNATCEGNPIFSPTVQVTDGEVPPSPTFRVLFPGEYRWVAEYSGDTAGNQGFTRGVIGDCQDEPFTVADNETGEILTVMQRQDGNDWVVVEHTEFVQTPLVIRDLAVIYDVAPDVAGTVQYQLFEGETCEGTLLYDETFNFTGGTPGYSEEVPITALGIYNWVVTVQIEGREPIVSPCGSETFIVVEELERVAAIACTYHPATLTASYGVNISRLVSNAPNYDPPRPGSDVSEPYPGLIVEYRYLNEYNQWSEWDTYNNYDSGEGPNNPNFLETRWRQLEVSVTWPNGETYEAEAGCLSSLQQVEITTTMRLEDENGDVINNGDLVPFGSTFVDTALMEENTINATGTVTYQLYRGAYNENPVCSDVTEANLIHSQSFPVSNPGEPSYAVPATDAITADVAGNYYWVVSYDGNNLNAPANSPCPDEWFRVAKFEPALTTEMYFSDDEGAPGGVIENGQIIPIDSVVTDTAVISGQSDNATGEVTYELFRGGVCGEDGVLTGGVSLGVWTVDLEEGLIPNVGEGIRIEQIGFYTWIVSYSGDASNEAAVSGCGLETFQVEQAEPTITTAMQYEDGTGIDNEEIVPIDSWVIDTAAIEGQSNNATGTVTYQFYRGEVCEDQAAELLDEWEVDLGEGGVIPGVDPSIKVEHVGVYFWVVTYSGDANNVGYTSPGCDEWFQVNPTQPELTTVMRFAGENGAVIENGETDVPIDSLVTDTAYFEQEPEAPNTRPSDNISGQVTFELFYGGVCEEAGADLTGGESLGVWQAEISNGEIGAIDAAVKVENAGLYTWIVTYPGDDNNEAARSGCGIEVFEVQPLQPEVTTVMFHAGEDGQEIENGSTVVIDSFVRDTATIEPLSDNATGEVTYTLIRTEDCAEENPEVIFEATYDLADGFEPVIGENGEGIKIENAGTYHWIVTYSGDSNNIGYPENEAAQSPCGIETFVVEQAQPEIVTEMYFSDEEGVPGDVITNGQIIPIDSMVTDTTHFNVEPEAPNTIPSDNVSGTITYTLYTAESCEVPEDEWQVIAASGPLDLVDGVIPAFEGSVKIENVGFYFWVVEYSGDANNVGNISGCGLETFEVEPAQPEIVTEMQYEDGTVIENGQIIPIDSMVTDTTHFNAEPEAPNTIPSDNVGGTITYTLYTAESCDIPEEEWQVIAASGPLDLVDGVIPAFEGAVKIENVGFYFWIVEYSGDANNVGNTSGCGLETFVVEQAQPEIVTEMYFSDEEGVPGDVITNGQIIPIDSVVTDTAIISSQSDNATGSVTYELFRGGICGEDGVLADGESLGVWTVDLENGLIPNVGEGIKIEHIGLYTWIVSYTGDANNEAAVSGCGLETFEVEPTQPSVVTTMKLSDGTVIENNEMLPLDSVVFDTAVISGQSDNATGTVTYQLYADALCTVPYADPFEVNLVDGAIPDSNILTIPNAGSYYWVVTYSGDANNQAAVSGCGEEFFHIDTVAPSVVTTMRYENGELIENDDVLFTDNLVIDTAVLIGATDDASGTATYQLFSDAACTVPVTDPEEVVVVNGVIPDSSVFQLIDPGSYYWVVTYSGDANNLAAVSGCGEEFFHAEHSPVTPEPSATPEPTETPAPEPTVPATPQPTEPTKTGTPPVVEKLPDTGNGTGFASVSLILASMAGLMLAAVAIRMNAYKRS